MCVYLLATMHSQVVGDNVPKPSREGGDGPSGGSRGVEKVDAAKSVSPVCIPSVGLRPIEPNLLEVGQGRAQTRILPPNVAASLPMSAAKLGGPEGPFSAGFGPIDLKPFLGGPGQSFRPVEYSDPWGQTLGRVPRGKKVVWAKFGVLVTPCVPRPLEITTRNLCKRVVLGPS